MCSSTPDRLIFSSLNLFHFSNYQPELNLEQTYPAGKMRKGHSLLTAIVNFPFIYLFIYLFNTEP